MRKLTLFLIVSIYISSPISAHVPYGHSRHGEHVRVHNKALDLRAKGHLSLIGSGTSLISNVLHSIGRPLGIFSGDEEQHSYSNGKQMEMGLHGDGGRFASKRVKYGNNLSGHAGLQNWIHGGSRETMMHQGMANNGQTSIYQNQMSGESYPGGGRKVITKVIKNGQKQNVNIIKQPTQISTHKIVTKNGMVHNSGQIGQSEGSMANGHTVQTIVSKPGQGHTIKETHKTTVIKGGQSQQGTMSSQNQKIQGITITNTGTGVIQQPIVNHEGQNGESIVETQIIENTGSGHTTSDTSNGAEQSMSNSEDQSSNYIHYDYGPAGESSEGYQVESGMHGADGAENYQDEQGQGTITEHEIVSTEEVNENEPTSNSGNQNSYVTYYDYSLGPNGENSEMSEEGVHGNGQVNGDSGSGHSESVVHVIEGTENGQVDDGVSSEQQSQIEVHDEKVQDGSQIMTGGNNYNDYSEFTYGSTDTSPGMYGQGMDEHGQTNTETVLEGGHEVQYVDKTETVEKGPDQEKVEGEKIVTHQETTSVEQPSSSSQVENTYYYDYGPTGGNPDTYEQETTEYIQQKSEPGNEKEMQEVEKIENSSGLGTKTIVNNKVIKTITHNTSPTVTTQNHGNVHYSQGQNNVHETVKTIVNSVPGSGTNKKTTVKVIKKTEHGSPQVISTHTTNTIDQSGMNIGLGSQGEKNGQMIIKEIKTSENKNIVPGTTYTKTINKIQKPGDDQQTETVDYTYYDYPSDNHNKVLRPGEVSYEYTSNSDSPDYSYESQSTDINKNTIDQPVSDQQTILENTKHGAGSNTVIKKTTKTIINNGSPVVSTNKIIKNYIDNNGNLVSQDQNNVHEIEETQNTHSNTGSSSKVIKKTTKTIIKDGMPVDEEIHEYENDIEVPQNPMIDDQQSTHIQHIPGSKTETMIKELETEEINDQGQIPDGLVEHISTPGTENEGPQDGLSSEEITSQTTNESIEPSETDFESNLQGEKVITESTEQEETSHEVNDSETEPGSESQTTIEEISKTEVEKDTPGSNSEEQHSYNYYDHGEPNNENDYPATISKIVDYNDNNQNSNTESVLEQQGGNEKPSGQIEIVGETDENTEKSEEPDMGGQVVKDYEQSNTSTETEIVEKEPEQENVVEVVPDEKTYVGEPNTDTVSVSGDETEVHEVEENGTVGNEKVENESQVEKTIYYEDNPNPNDQLMIEGDHQTNVENPSDSGTKTEKNVEVTKTVTHDGFPIVTTSETVEKTIEDNGHISHGKNNVHETVETIVNTVPGSGTNKKTIRRTKKVIKKTKHGSPQVITTDTTNTVDQSSGTNVELESQGGENGQIIIKEIKTSENEGLEPGADQQKEYVDYVYYDYPDGTSKLQTTGVENYYTTSSATESNHGSNKIVKKITETITEDGSPVETISKTIEKNQHIVHPDDNTGVEYYYTTDSDTGPGTVVKKITETITEDGYPIETISKTIEKNHNSVHPDDNTGVEYYYTTDSDTGPGTVVKKITETITEDGYPVETISKTIEKNQHSVHPDDNTGVEYYYTTDSDTGSGTVVKKITETITEDGYPIETITKTIEKNQHSVYPDDNTGVEYYYTTDSDTGSGTVVKKITETITEDGYPIETITKTIEKNQDSVHPDDNTGVEYYYTTDTGSGTVVKKITETITEDGYPIKTISKTIENNIENNENQVFQNQNNIHSIEESEITQDQYNQYPSELHTSTIVENVPGSTNHEVIEKITKIIGGSPIVHTSETSNTLSGLQREEVFFDNLAPFEYTGYSGGRLYKCSCPCKCFYE